MEWVKRYYTAEWAEQVLTKRASGEKFFATRGLPAQKKKCDVCVRFNKSGSNAYVQQKTRLVCGDMTKQQMNVVQSNPKKRELSTPPSAKAKAEPKRK